jgi:hypothetical protein
MIGLHPDLERLALLGWKLAPATAAKKGLFRGYLDAATDDLHQIAAWQREHPRACWKVRPQGSGVWFLDVDVPGGTHRHDGVTALRALCDLHGPLPPGPRGRSPSGGHLLVFRDTGVPIRRGAAVPAPGLDTLHARLCPMVSPSQRAGGVYRWLVAPWDLDPAPAPEWLLALLAPPPPPLPAKHSLTADTARRGLGRALDAISVARWIAAGLLDEVAAVGALYAAGRTLGLADCEVRATIKSGFRAGCQHPLREASGHV